MNNKFELLKTDLVSNVDEFTEAIFSGIYNLKYIKENNMFNIYKNGFYVTLKYYNKVEYDTLDEICDYIRKKYTAAPIDIYVDKKFNGEYSIITIKASEHKIVAKYGIYQPCVEKYHEFKSMGLNSWDKELIRESLKYKPFVKNNFIYICHENI